MTFVEPYDIGLAAAESAANLFPTGTVIAADGLPGGGGRPFSAMAALAAGSRAR